MNGRGINQKNCLLFIPLPFIPLPIISLHLFWLS
jgi:hypothetical protein